MARREGARTPTTRAVRTSRARCKTPRWRRREAIAGRRGRGPFLRRCSCQSDAPASNGTQLEGRTVCEIFCRLLSCWCVMLAGRPLCAPCVAVFRARFSSPGCSTLANVCFRAAAVAPVSGRAPPTPPPPSGMILDEFVLLKKLGEGAFATVWAARKVDDRSRLYAVKHLKQADDPARGVNLLATPEFRSLKAIPRCPHVLRAVQVARERGQVFLVTEWCDTDLLKLVESARDRGAGGLPERVAASALRHLLLALERVHASKWTHRDVKPENILIANGVAKLADFGEATEFANEDARRTYVGTRWYRAPEQFLLADEVRRPGAADVWAAGCVLVECLLGHALFRGASDADMLRKIAETIGARGVDAETAASFARLAENGVAPRGDGRLEEIVRGQNPAASPAALDLARKLLTIDPERRITAAEALRHPFVRDAGNAPVALDAAGTPSAPGLRVGGGGGGGGVGGVGRATAAGRGGGGAAARAPPPPRWARRRRSAPRRSRAAARRWRRGPIPATTSSRWTPRPSRDRRTAGETPPRRRREWARARMMMHRGVPVPIAPAPRPSPASRSSRPRRRRRTRRRFGRRRRARRGPPRRLRTPRTLRTLRAPRTGPPVASPRRSGRCASVERAGEGAAASARRRTRRRTRRGRIRRRTTRAVFRRARRATLRGRSGSGWAPRARVGGCSAGRGRAWRRTEARGTARTS